jgi:ATP-binding cassette subfamily A (ABC1) protein 5
MGLVLSLITNGGGGGGIDSRFTTVFIAVLVPTAFSLTCRFILMQMVVDKETKMRETLRIMSMKTGAYGLSYFLTQVIFTIFVAIVLTIIFTVKSLVPTSDALPLFVILMF